MRALGTERPAKVYFEVFLALEWELVSFNIEGFEENGIRENAEKERNRT